jgi:predicted AAA+ superfamily ATPase
VIKVFEHIWRGGMPQVLYADNEQRLEYYNAYVDTYLMRDVAELGGVTDTLRFRKFLTACAALVARQVNYKTLAESSEISQPTAREWLRLLESLGIVYLLYPYSGNMLKRLTKTPKLYFCDSGLCAHLSMWLTAQTLMTGAAGGHFFENFVITELLKAYAYSGTKVNFTYYRDSNDKEIDLLVEENNRIHPLEIKMSSNPDRREVKKFVVVEKAGLELGHGGIICMCEEVIPIDEKNSFVPCNLI